MANPYRDDIGRFSSASGGSRLKRGAQAVGRAAKATLGVAGALTADYLAGGPTRLVVDTGFNMYQHKKAMKSHMSTLQNVETNLASSKAGKFAQARQRQSSEARAKEIRSTFRVAKTSIDGSSGKGPGIKGGRPRLVK